MAPESSPSGTEKSRLRSRIRAGRRSRSAAEAASARRDLASRAGAVTAAAGDPAVVGAYLAAEGEPDPIEAMRHWHAAGLRVLVPLSRPGRRLDWVRWNPGLPTRIGALAPVPEPVGGVPADPAELDLVVVPALALAADGTRLGQGGGFYDSFLSDLESVTTVGLVFDDEVLPCVPADDWDAVLDAVWTPSRFARLPQ